MGDMGSKTEKTEMRVYPLDALIPEDMGVIFNLVRGLQSKYDDVSVCYEEALRLFMAAKNEEDALAFDSVRERKWYAMMERGAALILDLFGVDVKARARKSRVVDGRTVFCYRMRQEGISLMSIGRFLKMNHSSVIFHCKRMADAFELPHLFQDLVEKYKRFDEAL